MKVDIITESLYSLHNTPSNHPVYTWSLQTADSSVTPDCACPSVTFIRIHGILPGLYLLSSQDFSASWWVSLKSNKNLVGSISAQTPTRTGHYTFGLLLWYHGATTPSDWDSEYLDYMSTGYIIKWWATLTSCHITLRWPISIHVQKVIPFYLNDPVLQFSQTGYQTEGMSL